MKLFTNLDVKVTVTPDLHCECKITHDGFTITSRYEQGKEQIGLAISVGKEGVDMHESQKVNSDGFFEIKLRKPRPGLLKHYWMGKTQRDLDFFRFDALISDRQVNGDHSLAMPTNEPAIWLPSKDLSPKGERPVLKANKTNRKK